MNTLQQLKEFKAKLEPLLESFFNDKIEKAKKINPNSVEMIELLKEFTLRGGKRIRAALIYYTYKSITTNNEEEILKASMSIELAHAFLLIHDDIIDQDNMRRSGPTIHSSYKNIFKDSKNPSHYGTSFAILAGDILFAFANEILANINLNESNKNKAIQILNHVVHQVIYGESLDVLSSIKPQTKESLEQINYLKTASYTFEGPLHIGAVLANANKPQLEQLSKIAIPLGKAFQLQDDLLDLFSTEEKIGKPIASDIKEGKKTVLILTTLENANEEQATFINKCLGNTITKEDINKLKNIIIETKAKQQIESMIKDFITEAKSHCKDNEFLLNLADYMLERNH
tara:strand:+ start:152 stop:1183 length:1032 start_codon:yes stop_codon:yes gene_type:complete